MSEPLARGDGWLPMSNHWGRYLPDRRCECGWVWQGPPDYDVPPCENCGRTVAQYEYHYPPASGG